MNDALLAATCPRCGGAFECGANVGHCDCFGIHLTDTLRAELAQQYSSCLCLRCLRALTEAEQPPQPVIGSASASG